MSNLTTPQRQFMPMLLPLLICRRGRANFRNLSRYSDYHENSFSRGYRRGFDLLEFNRLSLLPLSKIEATLIAATDCSFIPKSGKHTEGLGKFYNGLRGQAEQGLEILTLAVVNVTANTAYNLSTRQTPATSQQVRLFFHFSSDTLINPVYNLKIELKNPMILLTKIHKPPTL